MVAARLIGPFIAKPEGGRGRKKEGGVGREKKKEVESRGKEKEDGGWEEEEGRGERVDPHLLDATSVSVFVMEVQGEISCLYGEPCNARCPRREGMRQKVGISIRGGGGQTWRLRSRSALGCS